MTIRGFFLSQWRRWRLRHELYDDRPERHPALIGIVPGEVLPWKGTLWKIASVREVPIPCVILVPKQETTASKVRWLKKLRRTDRILTKQERTARAALEKRAQGE